MSPAWACCCWSWGPGVFSPLSFSVVVSGCCTSVEWWEGGVRGGGGEAGSVGAGGCGGGVERGVGFSAPFPEMFEVACCCCSLVSMPPRSCPSVSRACCCSCAVPSVSVAWADSGSVW